LAVRSVHRRSRRGREHDDDDCRNADPRSTTWSASPAVVDRAQLHEIDGSLMTSMVFARTARDPRTRLRCVRDQRRWCAGRRACSVRSGCAELAPGVAEEGELDAPNEGPSLFRGGVTRERRTQHSEVAAMGFELQELEPCDDQMRIGVRWERSEKP